MVNILREDSRKWIKMLTDTENMSIRKYTYNSGDKKPDRLFERSKTILRDNIAENPKLREYANTISDALKKVS